MASTPLRRSPAPTPLSKMNGETLSFEKKAIQRLLTICGPRSRTTLGSILLDLIVFNRISPEVVRHLNTASRSLSISPDSPDTPSPVIPLSTLVDSIFLEEKTTALSSEMRRLLNVWNLIGRRSGISGANFWVIVGPSSISEYLATLSWFAESLSRKRRSARLKQSRSTPSTSSVDGSSSFSETLTT